MATRTASASGGDRNWNTIATWDEGAVPIGGDDVVFNSSSGDVAMDVNSADLGSLDMTTSVYAGTLSGTSKTLDIAGACTLAGTISLTGTIAPAAALTIDSGCSFTNRSGLTISLDGAAGSHNLTTNGVSLPNLSMPGASTIVAQDNVAAYSLTLGAGTYTAGAYTQTLDTHIVIPTGVTLTSTGAWAQTGSGNLQNIDYGNRFAELSVAPDAGDTCTLTGTAMWTKKFTYGAGTIDETGGARPISIDARADNFFVSGTGSYTATGSVSINLVGKAAFANGEIDVGSTAAISFDGYYAGNALTMSGPITCGDLAVRGMGGTFTVTLNMVSYSLNCSAVALGSAADASRGGILEFGAGISNITSIARGAGNTASEVHFDSAYIEASGTIDLTGFTITNTAAHIECGAAGNVDNMPATVILPIHAYGDSPDGGSNHADADIDFNEHAPPGSRVFVGAGI